MKSSVFLDAFKGSNKTVPVWFMRQAGRYLPEYQAYKEKYSLNDMFNTPEIAAEITCLPVDILSVDAAILFADILTLPQHMGFNISFSNKVGPVVGNPIRKAEDVKHVHDFENLQYVAETVKAVNDKLPEYIPLIGFAGSPFTVLTYLVDKNTTLGQTLLLELAMNQPEVYHSLMDTVTKNTIGYLNLQKEAGIKVFQLFDSWAGILRPADYAHLVLPYVKRIFEEVDLPSIYYVKNCRHLLELMHTCKADFLSVCHSVVLGHHKLLEKQDQGIQGNLFNGLLFADPSTLKKEVHDVLKGAKYYNRYIFNLNHGVLPTTNVDKLKMVVDEVHEFQWNG